MHPAITKIEKKNNFSLNLQPCPWDLNLVTDWHTNNLSPHGWATDNFLSYFRTKRKRSRNVEEGEGALARPPASWSSSCPCWWQLQPFLHTADCQTVFCTSTHHWRVSTWLSTRNSVWKMARSVGHNQGKLLDKIKNLVSSSMRSFHMTELKWPTRYLVRSPTKLC